MEPSGFRLYSSIFFPPYFFPLLLLTFFFCLWRGSAYRPTSWLYHTYAPPVGSFGVPNVCRIVSETALYMWDMLVYNNSNATCIRKPVLLGAWRPVLALTCRFSPEGRRAKAPNRRSPTSKFNAFVDHPTGFFSFFFQVVGRIRENGWISSTLNPHTNPDRLWGTFSEFSRLGLEARFGDNLPEVRLKCLF